MKQAWNILLLTAQQVLHHRARALVWALVGSINTVILLMFWWATLRAQPSPDPELTLSGIVSYYLLMTTFGSFIICHEEEEVATNDIAKGQLTTYILKPYSYFRLKLYDEIAWRALSGFWSILLLTTLSLFLPISVSTHPEVLLLVFVTSIMSFFLSFFFKMCQGLAAIWLTNTKGLDELLSIVSIIGQGFTLPLWFFPEPWRDWLLATPLAGMVYLPVALLIEQIPLRVGLLMTVAQIFWLVVFFVLAHWMFVRGVKTYTGVSQ